MGTLGGRLGGVPVAIGALTAGLTAAASYDTSRLSILIAATVTAFALGWWWAVRCQARGWWLSGAVMSAGALGSLTGVCTWAAVALDRCFTF